jgi:signal transduction histidine kinase/CheY-like chemotaxis protein
MSSAGESKVDPAILARAKQLSVLLASCALVMGLIALLGWALDVDSLKALSRGVTMKANTAFGLSAAATAMLLLHPERAGRARRALGRALAALVATLGAATLSQHIVGWDLHIDQLLFEEARGAIFTTSPGRMGPPASLSFFLIGSALWSIDARPRADLAPTQLIAVLVGAIGLLPALGYLSGAVELFGVARYTGIAANTAVGLIALAAALVLARPTHRPALLLIQDDAGGRLARRLLPAALLGPLVIQLTVRGFAEQTELVDASFGRALVLLLSIGLFAWLGWTAAARLSAESQARDQAERTSQEMLERERVARSDAERAVRLKDDFVATVSHELRTPLNAMLGWAAIVRTPAASAEQRERGLMVIERNAKLQARLIDDLLDMSRIVRGKLVIDVQPTEICGLVQTVVNAHRPPADEKGIELSASFEPAQIEADVDPARIQQVVWNLLSNAIKFTPKGGHVAVKVRRSAEQLEIIVSDDGVGVAPEFVDQMFERFRQADSSTTRRHGGLGLGLAIARSLVVLHRGTLRADSEGIGRGTTLTIELPLRFEGERASTERPDAVAERAETGQRLAGVRILLVEDDPDSRELFHDALTELGAVVTSARDAEEAMAALVASAADVFITDIGMPGQDGYALLKRVREERSASELPAIALTAFASARDKQRALDEGFQAHLSKPVDFAALTLLIETLAGRVSRS